MKDRDLSFFPLVRLDPDFEWGKRLKKSLYIINTLVLLGLLLACNDKGDVQLSGVQEATKALVQASIAAAEATKKAEEAYLYCLRVHDYMSIESATAVCTQKYEGPKKQTGPRGVPKFEFVPPSKECIAELPEPKCTGDRTLTRYDFSAFPECKLEASTSDCRRRCEDGGCVGEHSCQDCLPKAQCLDEQRIEITLNQGSYCPDGECNWAEPYIEYCPANTHCADGICVARELYEDPGEVPVRDNSHMRGCDGNTAHPSYDVPVLIHPPPSGTACVWEYGWTCNGTGWVLMGGGVNCFPEGYLEKKWLYKGKKKRRNR